MSLRICVKCNEEYKLYRGKPGFINECGKSAILLPYIEIVEYDEAYAI